MNESQPDHRPERAPDEPQPRIWITSLADYNNGILTGDWVDAAVSEDDLLSSARSVLARSETIGAEEWAIFDYEGFGSWIPGEYEQLDVVARVARGIREHGLAFAAWAELRDADPSALANFTDAYLGEYDSSKNWAESVAEDLGLQHRIDEALSAELACYVRFDSETWAHDAWLSGDIAIVHKPGGGVWIFDGHL